MLSEQNITERLERLDQKSAQLRATMREVAQFIIAKTAAAYLAKLPENEQAKIRSLPDQEAARYIAEHRNEFPPMTQEKFETIHDETWEDYFRSTAR